MARVNRTNIIQKAVNDLGLSTSGEVVPNETLDKIQCTFSLNPHFSSFILTSAATTTGNITANLPTVSAGSEIYCTSITASFAKDATCDIATGRIQVRLTPDASNVIADVMNFAVITLTADSQTATFSFPYPIKLKVGSTILMSGAFTVGVLSRALSITGFTTSSN